MDGLSPTFSQSVDQDFPARILAPDSGNNVLKIIGDVEKGGQRK